ncbi:sensor domain-containing diguanylate cyclase [Pleionea sediminis]|uniref:sensor domain-containing diguanylate cyclase n=1 Tax=Pleionea sediminis TaxID=2569479 RepID=UPI0011847781|nr:GGDEF domain-containing protein [Pleionea sediminis]
MGTDKKQSNRKASSSVNTVLSDTQTCVMQAILKHAPILISAKDTQGNILFTSDHFTTLKGPIPRDYINKNVFDLFPQAVAEQLWNNDLKAQKSKEAILVEEEVEHADGSWHIYQTAKFRLLDGNDNLIGTCAVSFDITHLKKLEYDVQHDSLTELYNRRFLDVCFNNELKRAKRDKRALLFVLLDLDGFKKYNDKYGHVKGDELLIQFSKQLKKTFRRPSDFCFRLGGDEFAVILTADQKDEVQPVQELSEKIQKLWRIYGGFACTVSAGIRAIDGKEKLTSKQAYRDADVALYRAKEQGRNQICFFA